MSKRLPGALCRWLTLLPHRDLLAVQDFIAALLRRRKDAGPDPTRLPSGEGARTGTIWYRQEKVRCGKSGCRRCAIDGGHGPYWYAYFRQGRKMRSRYIGKDLTA